MSNPEEPSDLDEEIQPDIDSVVQAPEKTDYEFELATICIKVTTNASGDAEPVNLTFSNFVNTDNVHTDSIYPYFITDYAYPHNSLMTMTRPQQLAFFFDKSTFLRKMEKHVLNTGGKSIEINISNYAKNANVIREINTTDIQPPAIAIANINTMIQILFPTIFPFPGNNVSAFLSPSNNIPTPITGTYSHINVGGKPSTVIKTIWCDDCINHPLYKKMVTGYINLLEICKEKRELNEIVVSQKTHIIEELLKKITRSLLEKNKSFMLTPQTNDSRNQYNVTDDQSVVQSLQEDIENITKIADKPIDKTASSDDITNEDIIASSTNIAIESINKIFRNVGEREYTSLKSIPYPNTLINDGGFKNILELLNRINERKANLKRTSFEPELFTILSNLHRNIVEYRILTHINMHYLDLTHDDKCYIRPGIQLDDEIANMRRIVKLDGDVMTKYYPSQYDEFIQSLQKIAQLTDLRKMPKYKQDEKISTPGSTFLLDKHAAVIIDNFIKTPTKESIDDFNAMMQIAGDIIMGKNMDTVFDKSLYTGFTRKSRDSETDYEMYMHIDVIGGIITAENIRNVKCKYKDASIGEYFSNRTTESTAIIRPSVFVSL